MKQLARARSAADLTWQQVVEDARRSNEYSSLTPEDALNNLQGFGRPTIKQPSDSVVAAVNMEAINTPKKARSGRSMMAEDHHFAV